MGVLSYRWKHGKVDKKKHYPQSSKKMVQFFTKIEESRLKIIENNIIKAWCLLWVYNEVIMKFEKLWHNKNR